MESVPLKLRRFLSPGKVFIFSLTYCPYCDKAKELLDEFEVKYEYVTVDKEPELDTDEDFINTLHTHSKITTYPKIYIGLNCIGGYTDMFKMKESMRLFTLLKSEGVRFLDDDLL